MSEGSRVRKVIEMLFRIYDKEGKLVDFKLNRIQQRFDEEIILPLENAKRAYALDPSVVNLELIRQLVRNSVLKYRQGGISTLVLAWFLVEAMNEYACCVMLTHDKEHSEKLLYRARIMLKNLKGPKPKTSKLNDNEIAFEKTDSLFYIGTAGSKEFGRSATITHLHCSEIAFWKDPARLMKSLFQAVPKTGVIVHETTANGWGNWFQKSFYSYLSGMGGFHPRFYPWYIHEEYYSLTPYSGKESSYNLDDWATEQTIRQVIANEFPELTTVQLDQKLQWRREKIAENLGDQGFDVALRDFQQEYPYTYEEAFVVSGGMLFRDLTHAETSQWIHPEPGTSWLKGHPVQKYDYALGADFAGGTGNDNSSIVIQCVQTKEQVYRYANKYINPVDFAHKIANVGERYSYAYLVPEYNNHGIAGVAILKKIYPLVRIYKHVIPRGQLSNSNMNVPSYGYGWKTSASTKPYMIGVGIQFTLHGYQVHDAMTYDELKSFAEDPDTGKIDGMGDHDDCGIAWMLSCIGILKLLRVTHLNPDEVTESLELASHVGEVLETKELEEVTSLASETLHTHRDEQGRFLVEFDDMFGKGPRRTRRVA